MAYYRTRSFRPVNLQVDAPVSRQIKMVGHHHNTIASREYVDPFAESSDDEDVDGNMAKQIDGFEPRTANFNKRLWMKSYAHRFEIPTSHVLNARTFIRGEKFQIMQMIKFVIPSELRTGIKVMPALPFFEELN